jgi:hypothetical protein
MSSSDLMATVRIVGASLNRHHHHRSTSHGRKSKQHPQHDQDISHQIFLVEVFLSVDHDMWGSQDARNGVDPPLFNIMTFPRKRPQYFVQFKSINQATKHSRPRVSKKPKKDTDVNHHGQPENNAELFLLLKWGPDTINGEKCIRPLLISRLVPQG